jgi:hypothetical protein
MNSPDIDWANVKNKDARGMGGYDLGEVQSVNTDKVITKKGLIEGDNFLLPISLVDRYDGRVLWFRITQEQGSTVQTDLTF